MSDFVTIQPARAELPHEDDEMKWLLFVIFFNAPKIKGGGRYLTQYNMLGSELTSSFSRKYVYCRLQTKTSAEFGKSERISFRWRVRGVDRFPPLWFHGMLPRSLVTLATEGAEWWKREARMAEPLAPISFWQPVTLKKWYLLSLQ